MTAKQIERKLAEAGITTEGLEVRRDEVEIYCLTRKGEYSKHLTDNKAQRVRKALGWGGYRCGYGAWVLEAHYVDMGDWNNPASRWHR